MVCAVLDQEMKMSSQSPKETALMGIIVENAVHADRDIEKRQQDYPLAKDNSMMVPIYPAKGSMKDFDFNRGNIAFSWRSTRVNVRTGQPEVWASFNDLALHRTKFDGCPGTGDQEKAWNYLRNNLILKGVCIKESPYKNKNNDGQTDNPVVACAGMIDTLYTCEDEDCMPGQWLVAIPPLPVYMRGGYKQKRDGFDQKKMLALVKPMNVTDIFCDTQKARDYFKVNLPTTLSNPKPVKPAMRNDGMDGFEQAVQGITLAVLLVLQTAAKENVARMSVDPNVDAFDILKIRPEYVAGLMTPKESERANYMIVSGANNELNKPGWKDVPFHRAIMGMVLNQNVERGSKTLTKDGNDALNNVWHNLTKGFHSMIVFFLSFLLGKAMTYAKPGEVVRVKLQGGNI